MEETRKKIHKGLHTNYELHSLGTSTEEGALWISEEERESHMHIIGTTGEGKSRFIEYLIRNDIKNGNGVCFLDPSENGDTMRRILKYCAKISHKKVCLIDYRTLHTHNRVSCLQPFHYEKSYKTASVAYIDDTIRTVFQQKDQSETARINRYLPALLHCLWNAEMTLHEAIYFTEYKHSAPRRKAILSHSVALDRHRLILDEVFDTYYRFNTEFSSTVRRLEPFFDSTLDLMFGADKGVDFVKMIAEGWVILVNLYSGFGFEPLHTRLLGTTIINEIIFALDRLRGRGWKGVYYLYIDEAGRYSNRNLADILSFKRKSGLRVTIAHQYFKQFEDPYILDALKNGPKLKVMFNTPNPHDRLEMMKLLGYGGEIPPSIAQYTNQDLPKQYAIIKKVKDSPLRVRIPDVKDIELDKRKLDEYVFQCLTHPWNFTPDQIREQMERRFDSVPVEPPKKPGRKPKSTQKTVFD